MNSETTVKPITADDRLTTEQLTDRFEVKGFSYGIVCVRDKLTGIDGTFDFEHMPRVYHSYQKDSK